MHRRTRASPFEELLSQLQQVHQSEVADLRSEKEVLQSEIRELRAHGAGLWLHNDGWTTAAPSFSRMHRAQQDGRDDFYLREVSEAQGLRAEKEVLLAEISDLRQRRATLRREVQSCRLSLAHAIDSHLDGDSGDNPPEEPKAAAEEVVEGDIDDPFGMMDGKKEQALQAEVPESTMQTATLQSNHEEQASQLPVRAKHPHLQGDLGDVLTGEQTPRSLTSPRLLSLPIPVRTGTARSSLTSQLSQGCQDGATKSTVLNRLAGGLRQPTRSGSLGTTFIFENIQPKHLDFKELSRQRLKGTTWEEATVQQKDFIIREALRPTHILVNPRGKFMKWWDILLTAVLAWVALITPYEVVFVPDVEWVFFVMNRTMDAIFAFDMLLQFFLPIEIQQPHRGGVVMMRDPMVIRLRYLKSWFILDVASIFPFEVLSIVMADTSPVWQRAKMTRCLRLIKLTKLMRMFRAMKLQRRWKNAVGMQVGTQRLVRFGGLILLLSHWMACLWGVIGLTLGAELCDRDGRLMILDNGGVNINEVSWVTTLFLGGKTSPDNPCNPFQVYAAALHWAVMTLTSIGYGDIVPVRLEEYIVGIICMFAGGFCWAYVIGSVCSIISNVNPVDRMFETNTDMLNLAMREANVPNDKRQDYREYLREAKSNDRRICFRQVAENFSPLLRKQLLMHSIKGVLTSVYYFARSTKEFQMDIAPHLVPRFFSRLEGLDSVRRFLCLIERGTVAHCGQILLPPNYFNDDFIVRQPRYWRPKKSVSLTYTQLLVLSRTDLEDVLERHPDMATEVWMTALKKALSRAVQVTAEAYRSWRRELPEGAPLSLADAFDLFRDGGEFANLGTTVSLSPKQRHCL